MATQSSLYNTDGSTRTFPSTKHIATKQHCAVYGKKVSDSLFEVINQDLYSLVNNSVVFLEAPSVSTYSQIRVLVADTQAELGLNPSDLEIVSGINAEIVIVAGIKDEVVTVANQDANITSIVTDIIPNLAEILLADTNATTATTQAGIATAQAVIATTKASEASASATLAEGYANSLDPITIVRKDSDTGVALLPKGTTSERPVSVPTGTAGMRYNETTSSWEGTPDGTTYSPIGGGATGGGADTVFVETSYTVTQNYTLTAGKSAITVGDANGNVTIPDGVTITINDGSLWAIVGA